MDFNIDVETFAAAYKCIDNANKKIDDGLGSFSELDTSALNLIQKYNVENDSRIHDIVDNCQELKDKMYKTIDLISQINIDAAIYFECRINDKPMGHILKCNEDGSADLIPYIPNDEKYLFGDAIENSLSEKDDLETTNFARHHDDVLNLMRGEYLHKEEQDMYIKEYNELIGKNDNQISIDDSNYLNDTFMDIDEFFK